MYQHSDNDNDTALSAKHVSDIKLMKSVCETASYTQGATQKFTEFKQRAWTGCHMPFHH